MEAQKNVIKGVLVKHENKWYVDINKSMIQVSYSCLRRTQLKVGEEVEGFTKTKEDKDGGSFNVFIITSHEVIPRPYMDEKTYKVTIAILSAYDTKTINRIIHKLSTIIKEREL